MCTVGFSYTRHIEFVVKAGHHRKALAIPEIDLERSVEGELKGLIFSAFVVTQETSWPEITVTVTFFLSH